MLTNKMIGPKRDKLKRAYYFITFFAP